MLVFLHALLSLIWCFFHLANNDFIIQPIQLFIYSFKGVPLGFPWFHRQSLWPAPNIELFSQKKLDARIPPPNIFLPFLSSQIPYYDWAHKLTGHLYQEICVLQRRRPSNGDERCIAGTRSEIGAPRSLFATRKIDLVIRHNSKILKGISNTMERTIIIERDQLSSCPLQKLEDNSEALDGRALFETWHCTYCHVSRLLGDSAMLQIQLTLSGII